VPPLNANNEVYLEIKAEKIEWKFTPLHQSTGESRKKITANKSLDNMTDLKYLGTRVTDKNSSQYAYN
jgi:Holliday junction resolvase